MSTYHDDRHTPAHPRHGEDFGEQFRHDVPGQNVHLNEEPQGRLDFSKGDQRGGGRPGGDAAQAVDQAVDQTMDQAEDRDEDRDDLTPATLLDEPRGRASDLDVQTRSARQLGLHGGPDEAEMAERDPVGADEARARHNLIHEHAADPGKFEFHEAQEIASRKR